MVAEEMLIEAHRGIEAKGSNKRKGNTKFALASLDS